MSTWTLARLTGLPRYGVHSSLLSTIPRVISAFETWRHNRHRPPGHQFAVQKGLQTSRGTVRWFDHDDLKSLEEVLPSIEKNDGNAGDH
jgi:serine palmitoyltransferase